MHRHHALGRQQIVENAKDTLFHLSGVAGPADQDQLFGQANRDHGLAAAAVALGISAEARQIDDGVFGHEASELVSRGPYQQGADELIVPGQLIDNANVDAIFRLRAAEEIGDIERLFGLQLGEEILLQSREMSRRHRDIVVPPYGVFSLAIADDKLVLGAASGVRAGLDHQRPVLRTAAFLIRQRCFRQVLRRQVGENRRIGGDALIGERMGKR